MKRIRIMHVVSGLATGGTERGVRNLLTRLDPAIFEQLVCSVRGGFESEQISGVRILTLGQIAGRAAILVPKLARLFRREQPHIVHSRNWATIEAVPAARWAGVPAIIHSEHGRDMQDLERSPGRRRLFRRLCYRWADRVFAVSEELRDYYLQQLGGAAGSLEVIANGVDTDYFRPNFAARRRIREQFGIAEKPVLIGTLGRLDPIKGQRTLFRAAERCVDHGLDFRIVVVGDGSERQSLQSEVEAGEALRERVTFVGETTDVVDWLNAFDVYVLSSVSEGMSNTLLEAMAVGVPVVATRVGGNSQVVGDDGCGLLFPSGDSEALAAHLQLLAGSPEQRRVMGSRARMRVQQNFSLDRMLQRYAQMYSEVLGCKIGRPPSVGGREFQIVGR